MIVEEGDEFVILAQRGVVAWRGVGVVCSMQGVEIT